MALERLAQALRRAEVDAKLCFRYLRKSAQEPLLKKKDFLRGLLSMELLTTRAKNDSSSQSAGEAPSIALLQELYNYFDERAYGEVMEETFIERLAPALRGTEERARSAAQA